MIPNVKVTAEEGLEFIGDDLSEDCSFDVYFVGLLLLFDHDVCVWVGGGGCWWWIELALCRFDKIR